MTISVLLSVYKSENPSYLDRALQSVWIDQTLKPDEIVLIEDGPLGDELLNVIQKWRDLLSDKLLILRNEQNLGLTKSLNRGIRYIKSDLIARMDSDDISLPERFAKQVNILDKNSDIGAVGSYIKLFPTPDFEVKYAITPTYLDLLRENQLAHPVVMFRKSVLEQFNLKYNNCLYAEDYELWSRLIKVSKIYNIPEVLLKYRRHDNTISAIHSDLQSQNTQKTKQNMLDFLTHDKKLQHKICQLLAPKYIYKLFGFIPILKIKRKSDCDKWYLFCLIKFKTTKKV